MPGDTLNARVDRLMAEKCAGQSLSRVAREAGITFHTLQRTVNGDTTPNSYTVEKLARHFGVSVEYLYTGEEPPRPASDAEMGAAIEELRAQIAVLQAEVERLRLDG